MVVLEELGLDRSLVVVGVGGVGVAATVALALALVLAGVLAMVVLAVVLAAVSEVSARVSVMGTLILQPWGEGRSTSGL